MRWGCPHCGVNLALSDDKLGSGWSFSRCYKCGGFALVRRSEVNLIKVDKAPAGENVLLPEATETPMLSNQATQKLGQYVAKAESKQAEAKQAESNAAALAAAAASMANANIPPPSVMQNLSALPTPLPEMPATVFTKNQRNKILPAAIGVAATLAIASGIYLYIQGQILWDKARTTADSRAQTVKQVAAVSAEPRIEGSEAVAAPTLVSSNEVLSDTVSHSAMAPSRAQSVADGAAEAMIIKAKNPNARLHSGPGTKYPVVGIIDAEVQYSVVEWNTEWFKIVPKKSTNVEAAWVRNDMVSAIPAALSN